jgi:YD repeat-containing protein
MKLLTNTIRYFSLSLLFGLAALPATAQVDLAGYNSPYVFQTSTNAYNWGNTMPVQFSIANYGSTAYTGTFNVGFYLSRDTTITNSDDCLLGKATWDTSVLCSSTSGSMLPGYAYPGSVNVPLPTVSPFTGTPPPTNFYVAMWVDCDNQVAESNKTNNKNQGAGKDRTASTVTITVAVPHILATNSTAPYTNLTVNFSNVANDGPGNAVGVQTVTVINSGSAFLTVSGVSLTGSTNFTLTSIIDSAQSRFIIPASLPQTPQQIYPFGQETWVFTLQFDPTTNGAATGTLTITNNDPNTPVLNISLSGTGVPTPQIALTTPTSLVNFGGQVNDGAGGFQTTNDIFIQNNGSGPLTVSRNGISLLTGTQFSILSITSSTNGTIILTGGSKTIAPFGSETWDIKVRFDPLTVGVLNDSLKILSNDTNNPTFIVPLQGQGLNPAKLVVADAIGVISNRTEIFPGVDADGPGLQQATTNLTLQNYGDVPIIIPTNGLRFNSTTQFLVGSIVSSTAGVINLLTNSAQIAPDTNETWTVTLVFDPAVAGTLTNTLSIYASHLLTKTTAVVTNVPVSGTGLTRASLIVSNSVSPTNNLAVNFGTVLNDGTGGTKGLATLTLWNRGTTNLIIGQNGLTFSGGAGYSVVSVVSSTRGPVDLTSATIAMRTIAPVQAEFWTVTLAFDPAANGLSSSTLSIASNDQQNPTTQIALTGTGATPNITLNTPASQLNVSADSLFTLTWQTTYPLTNALITLYLDANNNPPAGLMPIATGIQNGTGNSYTWQSSPAFIGTNYYVYATMTDGSVTGSSFAAGRLKIDPVGAFQFLSSIVATNASYVYNYAYNGVTYTGTNQLALGANVIYVTNGSAIYQIIITRVPLLAQVDAVQYNQLNQVSTTTNGNGIVTTLTYDQMGRVVRRQSSNGAVVTYAYDVFGNRTNMTDYTGTTFYQYDDLNRLTAVTYSKDNILGNADDLVLSYEYDLAGNKTAIVYPGGERIQYTYDNAGRMSTVNNVTRSLLFQYTYNPVTGQLTKLTRPNGIETDYSYDGMGRLTNILHQTTSGGALKAQYGYTLDAIGKATLLTIKLPSGTRLEQYNYDYFDRLTNAVYADNGVISANSLSVSYTYDGNGNRLTMTTKTNNAVTEIRSYIYGNENRLLAVTNQSGALIASYAYDPAGNRLQKVTTNNTAFYTYDERNLMTSYGDKTNQIAYTCNGDAQRVSQTLSSALTTYIIDPSRSPFEVVQERNGSTVTASYTFGATRLATWNGSAVTFELTDQLGSVRLVTDAGGNVIQSYNYDAFGANR